MKDNQNTQLGKRVLKGLLGGAVIGAILVAIAYGFEQIPYRSFGHEFGAWFSLIVSGSAIPLLIPFGGNALGPIENNMHLVLLSYILYGLIYGLIPYGKKKWFIPIVLIFGGGGAVLAIYAVAQLGAS